MNNSLKNTIKKINKKALYEKRILLKKELFVLRFQKTLGELKNTSRFLFIKKDIARINTELTMRLKVEE